MALTQFEAWVCLPFLVPLCFYTAYTDLREMKIKNQTVLAMGGLFLVLGLITLPFDVYLWRLAQLAIVLVVGIVLNAAGVMGAGDAKFAAAAAPYVALGDLRLIIVLFVAFLITAFIAHRIAKHSPLRRMAPDWESWNRKKDFPMGLALGPCLATYLGLGAIMGS